MKSQSGHILLEALLGAILLAAGSIMLLHSAAFQRNLSVGTRNDLHAHALIGRIKQAFEGFMPLQEASEGAFPNGQSYRVEMHEDKETATPLERLLIVLRWVDVTTHEEVIIKDSAVRIR